MTDSDYKHATVLLEEAVETVVTDPDGVYIDGTFGRGGHSRHILQSLSKDGRLIAFDKDPEAVSAGRRLANSDTRFEIIHDSFSALEHHVQQRGLSEKVTGVLLDLGVSSPQLDDAARGFSFMKDGPLDMRMNTESGQSAAEWLNTADVEDISKVLKELGEERFAWRIAQAIVARREQQPLQTTLDLAKLIEAAVPFKEKGKHPATRSFQAIRIHINRELDDLSDVLNQALKVLKIHGRLSVISFHSLEDRMVKRFIKKKEKGESIPRHLPIPDSMIKKEARGIGRAIRASKAEVSANVRARSAIMRVMEKLG